MALKKADIKNIAETKLKGAGIDFKESEQLETFSIRLSAADKKVLQDHFGRRGLRLSSGLRMIIRDYINTSL